MRYSVYDPDLEITIRFPTAVMALRYMDEILRRLT